MQTFLKNTRNIFFMYHSQIIILQNHHYLLINGEKSENSSIAFQERSHYRGLQNSHIFKGQMGKFPVTF